VLADKELAAMVNFNLVPYGNAKTTAGKVTCQHGPTECLGNTIEACALDLMSHSNGVDFIVCFEHSLMSSPDPEAASKGCFAKRSWGVSEDAVNTCYKGPQGSKLIAQAAAATDADHKYTPWVDVNGVHDPAAEQNLKKSVCAALGASAPASCGSFGPDTEPKRSFASLAEFVV
jgi:interferon gamma-inducible protein 30